MQPRIAPPATARAVRLLRRGSPSDIAWSARRQLDLIRARASLAAAQRSDGPVVVGPFLGEVGFELLYWLPYLRRELRRRGIDRERVTALTRGGAGIWYSELAARHLDLLDRLTPDELRGVVATRSARSGTTKMLSIERVDRDLLHLAGVARAHLVHPALMYGSFRFLWEGAVDTATVGTIADYAPITTRETATALPPRFIAVKAYFSACFPDSPANRALLAGLVERLVESAPVVVLAPDLRVDDHVEWVSDDPRVHVVRELPPAANLAEQSAIVARADALVATYGGFSYLGPFVGVPTLAFESVPAENSRHLQVLRAALPQAAYEVVSAAEALDRARALVPLETSR